LKFRYSSDLLVIGVFLAISASILLFFAWATSRQWHLHKELAGRDRRRSRLLRSNRLFHFCRHYINFGLAVFLAAQLYCLVDRIFSLTTEVYLLLFSAFFVFAISPKNLQDIWVRFSIYIAAIFASVMAADFPEIAIHNHWVVDVFLVSLIVVVSIAIRITRTTKFRMTTQDVLVLLFVFATLLLIDFKWIEHVTFRLFCLVYALEYLLHREIYKFRLTRYLAALSGILIIAMIFPTLHLG